MMDLTEKTCVPCQGGVPPLPARECRELHGRLHKRWSLNDSATRLSCSLSFKNFKEPFGLAVQIGDLAEEEGHHPEIHLGWGHLDIQVWTHKIGALVESDFILAAKIDRILGDL